MKKSYKRVFAAMTALALVFGLALMGCSSDGGGGGLDLPPIDEQTRGVATITVTNAPLTISVNGGESTSPATSVNGYVFADGFSGNVGTITNGKLTLTLPAPGANTLQASSNLSYYFGGEEEHPATVTPSNVKFLYVSGFSVCKDNTDTSEYIYWLNRDATITNLATLIEGASIGYIYLSNDATRNASK
ncbi:hypothetical protein [Leadbettera azotonutricia]|uniref:hypothetical protein n=1 Tax=Leadbettera azotonutricia TaxID=150829 RepID=UPI0005C5AA64|nr:hypothetical protein [Leadbettera azotonutricia]